MARIRVEGQEVSEDLQGPRMIADSFRTMPNFLPLRYQRLFHDRERKSILYNRHQCFHTGCSSSSNTDDNNGVQVRAKTQNRLVIPTSPRLSQQQPVVDPLPLGGFPGSGWHSRRRKGIVGMTRSFVEEVTSARVESAAATHPIITYFSWLRT